MTLFPLSIEDTLYIYLHSKITVQIYLPYTDPKRLEEEVEEKLEATFQQILIKLSNLLPSPPYYSMDTLRLSIMQHQM